MADGPWTRRGDVLSSLQVMQDFGVNLVIAEFAAAFREEHHPALFYKKENGKYQLDLWEANRIVLREAGVPETGISVTDICTHCNPELLFSHRTSADRRGNLCAFLCLKEEGR